MHVIILFSFVSHIVRIALSHKTASKTNPFIHTYSCILYKTENNCPYFVSSSHNLIHYKKNDSLIKCYTTNIPLDYKKIRIIIYETSNNLISWNFSIKDIQLINILRPSVYYMYHKLYHPKILHSPNRGHLCIVYGSQNKQWVLPCTKLTDSLFIAEMESV